MDPKGEPVVRKEKLVERNYVPLRIPRRGIITYFSEPDEDNVSDDISEALMRGVIRDLRAAIKNPKDYTARSNLMWESTMGENRIIKLGKRMDFECHQMEHQLGAYTDCNHGAGLAVLHPVYYRHIYRDGAPLYWHNICGSVRNMLDRFYGLVEEGSLSGRTLYFLFQGASPGK